MTPPIDSFFNEYRFLSNFWITPIVFDGKVYPSVEHAYQAAKTFDEAEREYVRTAASPGKAKYWGYRVTKRPDWDDVRIHFMRMLVYQKFQDPVLAQLLLNTGDAELIEGNTWGDVYWGVCKGVGENHLGKILMEVRSSLRGEEITDGYE